MGVSEMNVNTVPPFTVLVVVVELLPHRQPTLATISKSPTIAANRLAIIAPWKPITSNNFPCGQSYSPKLRLPKMILTDWVHCSDGESAGAGYPALQPSRRASCSPEA
jgi:hypothetical protein